MTTITPEEALKSKKNFEEFMADYYPPIVTSTLASYPKADGQTVVSICDLTQKMETMVSLLNELENLNLEKAPFIVWYVTSVKEELVTAAKALNHFAIKDIKIFIFKAFLNGDKMGFECLLKPKLNLKTKREVNLNTPSKLLQKSYWEKYIEICDLSENPDMQIKEALPQHYQNISIQKSGVQILQTVNTQRNYVASEIAINNNKDLFERLLEHKEEIEKEIGHLEWDSKENNKSSKIRKIFEIDINNSDNHECAINEHIKMSVELKNIVHKYL